MGLIVDTCIFIKAEKNGTSNIFSELKEEAVYISAITASELLVGVHQANAPARRMTRTAFVDSILTHVPTLDFTLDVARIHSEIHSYLLTQGNMIGSHDLIIAATALCYNFTILTDNFNEFKRVPGLKIKTL